MMANITNYEDGYIVNEVFSLLFIDEKKQI